MREVETTPPNATLSAWSGLVDPSTGPESNDALREERADIASANGIVGGSRALRGVLERVERVAASGATVLITGETGTGK